uniref:Uncharacterized protein n=1 Tax=Romanomermis culicivorax TaxID=13658 RepID=A0A915I1J6_ROMCU
MIVFLERTHGSSNFLAEKFLIPMMDFLKPLADGWSTLAMHSASGLLRARMINNDASLSYIVENLKERKDFDLFTFLMADRGDVTLKMSMLRQVDFLK